MSARSKESDRVSGLETGINDYVVKPYSTSEPITRIKAQLLCTRAAAIGEQFTFGDIRLDAETHKVYRADNEVRLNPMEFRLLSKFKKTKKSLDARTAFGPRLSSRYLSRNMHCGYSYWALAKIAVPIWPSGF